MWWGSLGCFGTAFLIQGIFIAFILTSFNELSDERRRGQITELGKVIQALISLPLKPILEGILRKDPITIKILLTFSVIISFLVAWLFFSQIGCMLALSIFLLIAIWCS